MRIAKETLGRLCVSAICWDKEQYGYISLGINGHISLVNDIDCDGARYWSPSSFTAFVKQYVRDIKAKDNSEE